MRHLRFHNRPRVQCYQHIQQRCRISLRCNSVVRPYRRALRRVDPSQVLGESPNQSGLDAVCGGDGGGWPVNRESSFVLAGFSMYQKCSASR
jgi:hypothetical protein